MNDVWENQGNFCEYEASFVRLHRGDATPVKIPL